jgi:hypothetical protein
MTTLEDRRDHTTLTSRLTGDATIVPGYSVAPGDAEDAARYRWLKSVASPQLAAIAYRVPAACAFDMDHPDEAIDAARCPVNPTVTAGDLVWPAAKFEEVDWAAQRSPSENDDDDDDDDDDDIDREETAEEDAENAEDDEGEGDDADRPDPPEDDDK